jgi:CheY-like chemotaxis protein
MDVMMPNMDGLEALASIRKREQTTGQHLPVIMATAHTEPSERAKFRQAGADGYLAKPIDINQLRTELGRVLGLR